MESPDTSIPDDLRNEFETYLNLRPSKKRYRLAQDGFLEIDFQSPLESLPEKKRAYQKRNLEKRHIHDPATNRWLYKSDSQELKVVLKNEILDTIARQFEQQLSNSGERLSGDQLYHRITKEYQGVPRDDCRKAVKLFGTFRWPSSTVQVEEEEDNEESNNDDSDEEPKEGRNGAKVIEETNKPMNKKDNER